MRELELSQKRESLIMKPSEVTKVGSNAEPGINAESL